MPINESNRTDDNDNAIVTVGENESTDSARLGTKTTGEKALHVLAETTVVYDPTGCPPIPANTSKYRIEFLDQDVTVSNVYSTMYTYTGSGRLHGFRHDYDDDDIIVRLTIDSEVIFEIKIKDLKDIGIDDIPVCHTLVYSGGDHFEFCPPYPICFSTQVLVEARIDSGSKKLKEKMTFITKDT